MMDAQQPQVKTHKVVRLKLLHSLKNIVQIGNAEKIPCFFCIYKIQEFDYKTINYKEYTSSELQ